MLFEDRSADANQSFEGVVADTMGLLQSLRASCDVDETAHLEVAYGHDLGSAVGPPPAL